MAKAKPIPDGYHNVTPYLVVKGAAAAIDFYKQVFGAVEIMRMPQPDGRVGHAELKFGDSFVMLADEFPEMDVVGPRTLGNSPVGLLLYVDDVDKTVERAVAKGAVIKKPVADQFYGDRSGTIEDPWGHKWTLAVHLEDVSPEEMQRRMAAMAKEIREVNMPTKSAYKPEGYQSVIPYLHVNRRSQIDCFHERSL